MRRPHPALVLTAAGLAYAAFALVVSALFDGERRWYLLTYSGPIGIPFVAFLFDRAERGRALPRAAWGVDLAVLIPALARAVFPLPLISGHALFLAYVLFTARSPVTLVTAGLVLVQVAYLKLVVWQDATFFGGLAAGALAGLVYRRLVSPRCART